MGDDQPMSWSDTYPNGEMDGQYFDCDQDGHGQVMSSKQYQCINGTGCMQSQSCLSCLASWGCYTTNDTNKKITTNAVCPADCDDSCFNDYLIAEQTLKYFERVTTDPDLQNKPFFIAAGLKRPHIAYFAPLRFYQQYGYDMNYSDISIAKHNKAPINMPLKATNNASGFAGYPDVSKRFYEESYFDPATQKNGTIRYVEDAYHSHLRAVCPSIKS